MQPARAYPGTAMPVYPLFKTAYNTSRNRSSDRPESYPKGVWLDIAAVHQRVSLQGKPDGQAEASATRPDDIALGSEGGSLHVEKSTVLVETSKTTEDARVLPAGTAMVVSFGGMKVDEPYSHSDGMTLKASKGLDYRWWQGR